jgi:hypothetical protein
MRSSQEDGSDITFALVNRHWDLGSHCAVDTRVVSKDLQLDVDLSMNGYRCCGLE